MEEKSSIIEEIKDIYLYLTEGEPSPDDEIEVQKELIEKFQALKESDKVLHKRGLIEDIIKKLEGWDTLEHWFIETPLPDKMKDFLEFKKERKEEPKKESKEEEEEKIIETEESTKISEEQQVEKLKEKDEKKPAEFDISEIVAQVSEQFKGEIDTLKEKIDSLQNEIKTKEETLQKIKQHKKIKKITPRKESSSKLPPLEIHLPQIKKTQKKSMEDAGVGPEPPEKPEETKAPEIPSSEIVSERESKLQKKQQQYKEKLEISLKQLEAIEQEMEEKIEEEQGVKDRESVETQIEEEQMDEVEKPQKESSSQISEEIPSEGLEEPPLDSISEKEQQLEKPKIKKLQKEKLEKPEPPKTSEPISVHQQSENKDLTPIPQNKIEEKKKHIPPPPPKKSEIPSKPPTPPSQKEKSEKPSEGPVIFESSKQETIPQKSKEESEKTTLPPKKPSISTMAIEEPVESDQKEEPKEKPTKRKGIAELEVEEVETPTEKPSKTDLFSVFSSVGKSETQEKQKSKSHESIKTFIPGTSRKSDQIEKMPIEEHQQNITKTPPPEPNYTEEIESKSIEELPRDKDSLYQELIALEGKRYSIEREYKSLKNRYEKGNIGDHEFKTEDNKLKNNLNDITKKITNIRRILSSL